MANVDLINRTFKEMRSDPNRWDQGHYVWDKDKYEGWDSVDIDACETTFCFAGFTLLVNGNLTKDGRLNLEGYDSRDYDSAAAKILEIDYDQADKLFHAGYYDTLEGYTRRVENVLGITIDRS